MLYDIHFPNGIIDMCLLKIFLQTNDLLQYRKRMSLKALVNSECFMKVEQ